MTEGTALAQVERLIDPQPETSEGDALDVLVTLIEAYEAQRRLRRTVMARSHT